MRTSKRSRDFLNEIVNDFCKPYRDGGEKEGQALQGLYDDLIAFGLSEKDANSIVFREFIPRVAKAFKSGLERAGYPTDKITELK